MNSRSLPISEPYRIRRWRPALTGQPSKPHRIESSATTPISLMPDQDGGSNDAV